MKDLTMLFYLAVVAIVILTVIYSVYVSKKRKQSKGHLHIFCVELSQSFHSASWLYEDIDVNDQRTNQEIAKEMNKKIQEDMTCELTFLFKNLYYFPPGCFKVFDENSATKRFMGKAFPRLKTTYLWYKTNKSLLDFVKKKFWEDTEKIILEELNKTRNRVKKDTESF